MCYYPSKCYIGLMFSTTTSINKFLMKNDKTVHSLIFLHDKLNLCQSARFSQSTLFIVMTEQVHMQSDCNQVASFTWWTLMKNDYFSTVSWVCRLCCCLIPSICIFWVTGIIMSLNAISFGDTIYCEQIRHFGFPLFCTKMYGFSNISWTVQHS